MNLITENDAKQAAEKGLVEAIKKSKEHHEQGRDMTSLELQVAIKDQTFDINEDFCALCQLFLLKDDSCEKCPLGFCLRPRKESVYRNVADAYDKFTGDPSNANHQSFIGAEAAMVVRLEIELAKVLAAEIKELAKAKAKEKK